MEPLSAIRRFFVGLRDAADKTIHPRRREIARSRLRQFEPRSVLFICFGNVCRSPYGERFVRQRFPDLGVDSAGFISPGRPPPDAALEAASSRGITHADHRSRLVTPASLATADAIFVFDRFNVKHLRNTPGARMHRVFWLGDFDPEWVGKRAIIDPWGKSTEEFTATFERIDRCVEAAIDAMLASESDLPTTDGSPERTA